APARLLHELAGIVHDAPVPPPARRGRVRHDLNGRPLPAVLAAASTPATAPGAARSGRIRDLDLQRPAVHDLAIELLGRRVSILGRGHVDEAKAPPAAAITIRDHLRRCDTA